MVIEKHTVINLGGHAALEHKMNIVFKCIQSRIAEIDKDQELWKNSSAWNSIRPPLGYEKNQAAIDALLDFSCLLRACLKADVAPKVHVEIGE